MKVLLDAKELRLEGTGLARYEREIASRVTATLPTVTVVTRRSLVDGSADLLGGRVIALPAWLPAIVIEQVVIPFIALCVRPSTFHALAGRLPSLLPRCRRVLTFHEDRRSYYSVHPPQGLYARLARRWQEWSELSSLRRSHEVLAISRAAAVEAANRSGRDPRTMSVVHHGVSDAFRPRSLKKQQFVMAYCTNDPRDDHAYLLQTLARLTDPPGLVIVGGCDPDTADEFRLEASKLGLRVDFRGRVTDDELAAVYSSALCYVHSSAYEGFGLAIAEAMACGAPVVARPSAALEEVAGDVAFRCRGPSDAARVINQLRSDVSLVQEASRRGLERSKLFDWNVSAGCTMQAYT